MVEQSHQTGSDPVSNQGSAVSIGAQPDRNSYPSLCQQVPSPGSSTRVSGDPAAKSVAGLSLFLGCCVSLESGS